MKLLKRTFEILIFSLLLVGCGEQGVIDPDNETEQNSLISIKANAEIYPGSKDITSHLTNPKLALVWTNIIVESLNDQTIISNTMVSDVELDFPLKVSTNLYDTPTDMMVADLGKEPMEVNWFGAESEMWYLRENPEGTSNPDSIGEYGIAHIVIFNDENNDGKLNMEYFYLFGDIPDYETREPGKDWIAGIAVNHQLSYFSNQTVIESMFSDSESKDIAIESLIDGGETTQIKPQSPGYTLSEFILTHEEYDEADESPTVRKGYYDIIDPSTELVNISLHSDLSHLINRYFTIIVKVGE